MGRIFEARKHVMFARWDRMAKAFTRIGKEIVIAVKAGGPDPASNPQLRRVVQNARSVNMPKDKVDAAIKRASNKDVADYQEIVPDAEDHRTEPRADEQGLAATNARQGQSAVHGSNGGGPVRPTQHTDASP
jgi:hypothetical protein